MPETPYIKPLLKQNRPIWIMGVHDVLSAKIAERAGYDAVGVQSLQMAFVNGQPDTGVITPSELLDTVRKIRRSISLPIMVDFEQGFGDAYAAVYWLHEFERAGAAALHIDDCGMIYKCVFCPPHVPELESMDSTCEKIRALVGERYHENFMIFGRAFQFRLHQVPERRRTARRLGAPFASLQARRIGRHFRNRAFAGARPLLPQPDRRANGHYPHARHADEAEGRPVGVRQSTDAGVGGRVV